MRQICEVENCKDFAYYHYLVSYGYKPQFYENNGKQFHNFCKKHNEEKMK